MSEPMSERERWQLELDKLQRGLQGDPFAFLGPQRDPAAKAACCAPTCPARSASSCSTKTARRSPNWSRATPAAACSSAT